MQELLCWLFRLKIFCAVTCPHRSAIMIWQPPTNQSMKVYRKNKVASVWIEGDGWYGWTNWRKNKRYEEPTNEAKTGKRTKAQTDEVKPTQKNEWTNKHTKSSTNGRHKNEETNPSRNRQSKAQTNERMDEQTHEVLNERTKQKRGDEPKHKQTKLRPIKRTNGRTNARSPKRTDEAKTRKRTKTR